MHHTPHHLAGQSVTVTPTAPLYGYANTEPLQFRVEDWHDRVFGQSWMTYVGNAASLGYAIRSVDGGLPTDNEVIYGKCPRGFGHLVHVSEIQDGAQ
ncbi:hypothetical protein ACF1AX_31375 [Streptomyces sp. NPDC014802]|uniref:hypothetical protein n=1 Tax=Streptomyces sp. NPDC014802 TaxID=3364917 RepID=UPI0036FECE08